MFQASLLVSWSLRCILLLGRRLQCLTPLSMLSASTLLCESINLGTLLHKSCGKIVSEMFFSFAKMLLETKVTCFNSAFIALDSRLLEVWSIWQDVASICRVQRDFDTLLLLDKNRSHPKRRYLMIVLRFLSHVYIWSSSNEIRCCMYLENLGLWISWTGNTLLALCVWTSRQIFIYSSYLML